MATHSSTVRHVLTTFARGLGVGSSLLIAASCTAILSPDDDVQRCGSADDCAPTMDNRYIAECRFDPDSNLDSTEVDKICVAAYKPSIGCNPDSYTGSAEEHPLRVMYAEYGMASRYSCEETPGVRGCPPETGVGCAAGLEPRESDDLCDDPDDDVRMVSLVGESDLAGQDILDQFCRSFFCDDSFVCDRTDDRCVPCDPDEPFGEGGCGTVFVGGAPSCAYTAPNTEDVCDGPDASTDEPKFGNCDDA
jgi:hypothetical protein